METGSLSRHIHGFLIEQTGSKCVADQGVEIQQALEQGSTVCQQQAELPHNVYIHCIKGWCGFSRYYRQEQYIWEQFSHQKPSLVDYKSLSEYYQIARDMLGELQPVNQQWLAALSSFIYPRCLISGAPGTGKTTTIIKLLLLLFSANPHLKVVLCAPTGKAAHRMLQGIHDILRLNDHSISKVLIDRFPKHSFTIHHLLRYNPVSNSFAYNSKQQLPYDMVIVDESSMLDVSLSYHLLQAIKAKASVTFIGDAHQLPAVGAGFVFGDLHRKMRPEESVQPIEYHLKNIGTIRPAVRLTRNFRFRLDSGIGILAESIRNYETININDSNDLMVSSPKNMSERKSMLQKLLKVNKNESLTILTATNHGPDGVLELNKLMQQVRFGQSVGNPMQHPIEGQPVIITRNEYQFDLYNGDTGMTIKKNGQWFFSFEHRADVPLHAIRHWHNANALTIHKSQGSEYDVVILVLPEDQEHKMLNRQLLYTAVTRAKKKLYIWAKPNTLTQAIQQSQTRHTFLQIL